MKIRHLIGVLLGASLIILTPTVASAHTFNHQVGCNGLAWSAQIYNNEQTNSIVVTVDGVVVHSDADFGTTDTGSSPWTPTADHIWSIVVNSPGTEWDHNVSGVQQACQPTTTVTIPEETTTSTTQPTTTASVPSSTEPSTTSSTASPTSSVDSTSTVDPTSTVLAETGTAPTPPPDTPAPILPVTGQRNDLTRIATGILILGAGLTLIARRPKQI